MSNLEVLNLEDNKLTFVFNNINKVNLPNLREINLSKNMVRDLRFHAHDETNGICSLARRTGRFLVFQEKAINFHLLKR